MEAIIDVTRGYESIAKVYSAIGRVLEKLDVPDAGWQYPVKSVQEWSRPRKGYRNTWPLSFRNTRDIE